MTFLEILTELSNMGTGALMVGGLYILYLISKGFFPKKEEKSIGIYDGKKDVEISKIKGEIVQIIDKVDRIENNHLKHLEERLNKWENFLIKVAIVLN